MFRVGKGIGAAMFCDDIDGWERAVFVAQDITRASALFATLAGPVAGRGGGVGETSSKSFNPFKGKSAAEVEQMFLRKGYVPKGPDPLNGRGTYVNPRTLRGYHIDAKHPLPKGPHIGVHRLRGSRNRPPRDFSLQ